MKISLSVEKDEAQGVAIQCSVQGLAEAETKERWRELMATVEKLLAARVESEPMTIRHGVFF